MDNAVTVKVKLDLSDIQDQLKGVGDSLSKSFGGGGSKKAKEDMQDISEEINNIRNYVTVATGTLDKFLKMEGYKEGINRLEELKEAFEGTVSDAAMQRIDRMVAGFTKGAGLAADQLSAEAAREEIKTKSPKTASTSSVNKDLKDREAFIKNAMFMAGPVIGWGRAFQMRQTFDALRTTHGQAIQQKLGMGTSVGGGVGLAVAGTAAMAAIQSIIAGIKRAVDELIGAMNKAHEMYAKALTSGIGMGMTVKRNILASVLGVSEEDVMRFGNAIAYINPKLETAQNALIQANGPLADVAVEFSVMKQNLSALFSQIGEALSPAIKAFVEDLNAYYEVLIKSEIVKDAAKAFNILFIAINDIIGLIEVFVAGFVNGIVVISESISLMINFVLSKIAKIPGMSKVLGGSSSDYEKLMEENKKAMVTSSASVMNLAKKVADNFFGGQAGLPGAQAGMKKLPASAWEKMGLVIGGGKSTNELIEKSNKYLETIAIAVSGGRGVARSGFGLNPITSNP